MADKNIYKEVFICKINHTACPAYSDGVCKCGNLWACPHQIAVVWDQEQTVRYQSKMRQANKERLDQYNIIIKKLDSICSALNIPKSR